jgi:hypothetical protein
VPVNSVIPPVPPAAPLSTTISNNSPHHQARWKKYSFIIPAVLLVLTIVIVGVVAQKYFSPKLTPTPTPTATPELIQATPLPTPKVVVKAKTYVNTTLAFSFEYPGEFVLGECGKEIYVFGSVATESATLCESTASAAIKIYTQDTPLEIAEGEGRPDEEAIIIGERDGVRQDLVKGEGTYISRAVVVKNNITYIFALIDDKYEKEFEDLIKTVEFIDDNPTAGWTTYRNAAFFYKLEYPPEWIASQSAQTRLKNPNLDYIEISKNLEDKSKHSLVIETEKNVKNAQLKANDIVSSTRNLVGWKSQPTVDVRNIGGGTAQVMQGVFDNNWQVYVVIWYKNRITQITWKDTIGRELQKTIDLVLSSFDLID